MKTLNPLFFMVTLSCLAAAAFAAPVPEPTRIPITAENAPKVRSVAEVAEEAHDGAVIRVRIRIAPEEWGRLRARYAERAPELFFGG